MAQQRRTRQQVLSIWFSLAAAVVALPPQEDQVVVALGGCEPRHLSLSQPGPPTRLLLAAVEGKVHKEAVLFFLQSHRPAVVLATVAVADQVVVVALQCRLAVALPEKVTTEELATKQGEAAAVLEVLDLQPAPSMAATVDLGLRLQLQEVPILTPVAVAVGALSPSAVLGDLAEVAAAAILGYQAVRRVAPLKQGAEVVGPLEVQLAPVGQALL